LIFGAVQPNGAPLASLMPKKKKRKPN